jgi:hypothetical protein
MENLIDEMVEVSFEKDDDFLKIRETLTRIGVASRRDQRLFQSCHILHKRGKYYIVHFKELFLLDGKKSDISDIDIGRRNRIVSLLEDWELLEVLTPDLIESKLPMNQVKVITFSEKSEWELIPKYNIGNSNYEAI